MKIISLSFACLVFFPTLTAYSQTAAGFPSMQVVYFLSKSLPFAFRLTYNSIRTQVKKNRLMTEHNPSRCFLFFLLAPFFFALPRRLQK